MFLYRRSDSDIYEEYSYLMVKMKYIFAFEKALDIVYTY